jgi:FixJ family two-component response regulator
MADRTVYIVDDDPGFRDSLATLLALNGFVTASFASGEDFLATVNPAPGSCALVDLRMPGLDGLEVQARLAERGLGLPLVIITAHGDAATARAALKGGAVDFLEKPVDESVLLEVVNEAINTGSPAPSPGTPRPPPESRLDRLTPREREVLERVALGHSIREIAAGLDISPRTVEVYKSRLSEKLQARNTAELIRIALGVERG